MCHLPDEWTLHFQDQPASNHMPSHTYILYSRLTIIVAYQIRSDQLRSDEITHLVMEQICISQQNLDFVAESHHVHVLLESSSSLIFAQSKYL